jgi:hypothetical protein
LKKSRTHFACLLMALSTVFGITFVTGAETANAYVTEGCINPYTANGAYKDISFRGADIAGYTTLSSLSAGRWNSAVARARLVPVTSGYRIYASETNLGNDGYAGLTYVAGCSGGTFATANSSYANTYYNDSYPNGERFAVMVHEIGHALGLGHNAAHGNCAVVQIMYPSVDSYVNCGKQTPQSDDIAGINALY